jgi:hypothetical protein
MSASVCARVCVYVCLLWQEVQKVRQAEGGHVQLCIKEIVGKGTEVELLWCVPV